MPWNAARAAGFSFLFSVAVDSGVVGWAIAREQVIPLLLLVRIGICLAFGVWVLGFGPSRPGWLLGAWGLLELWPIAMELRRGELAVGGLVLGGLRWGSLFQLLLARGGESGRRSALTALVLVTLMAAFAQVIALRLL